MKARKFLVLAIAFLLSVGMSGLASAIVVDFVNVDNFTPGSTGTIEIGIENIFSNDVQDVSLRLDLDDVPFTPVGSSEVGVEEIEEGEEEDFAFRIKAANDITPGDYQIPYIITFKNDGETETKSGSVGVEVSAQTELSYGVTTQTPVIGKEGSIVLTIVNRGFADVKFVSVRIVPDGFTLLSEDEVYIGNVDSDDFETATFEVIFNRKNVNLVAIIDYRGFDNQRSSANINLPVNVYTQEEAIEAGLIERNLFPYYVGIIVMLIVLWFVWRAVRKRRRKKRSEGR